jgi:ribosomal protein L40E
VQSVWSQNECRVGPRPPTTLIYPRFVGRFNPGDLAMAFAEAINRRLKKKICLNCNVTNAALAKRCRKCHSQQLRVKALEARGGTAA